MSISEVLKQVEKWHENKKVESWRPGKDWVHYAGPYYDVNEYTSAVETLLNGWLVLGAVAHKVEKRLANLLGKEIGLLTNSGSSSNLLMMQSLKSKRYLNLPEGTKVLTPIAGFPTTINPIYQTKFTPVFCDIEFQTLNLDLDHVEDLLKKNPDIKVITFAHVLGNPPNMNRLMDIVKKYDLILLEDCCDALGSTYENKPLGSFGMMASISFYPAHHITAGEGGFVACNDLELEKVVRSYRDWGRGCFCIGKQNISACGACNKRFSNWLPSLPDEVFDHKYVYEEIGYNMKPIELQAALLNAQLDKFDKITSLRKRNYKLLHKIFSKYPEYFILPEPQKNSDPNWFSFPLTIKKNDRFNRADLCTYLESKKIQTRPYFAGNILFQPAYSHLVGDLNLDDFPNAKHVTLGTFFLGTSPVVTEEQISYIDDIVTKFFQMKAIL